MKLWAPDLAAEVRELAESSGQMLTALIEQSLGGAARIADS